MKHHDSLKAVISALWAHTVTKFLRLQLRLVEDNDKRFSNNLSLKYSNNNKKVPANEKSIKFKKKQLCQSLANNMQKSLAHKCKWCQ